jgi:hypothetical protein
LPEKKKAHFHLIEGFFVWLEHSDRRSANVSLTDSGCCRTFKMFFYYCILPHIGKGKFGGPGKFFVFRQRSRRVGQDSDTHRPELAGALRGGQDRNPELRLAACALQNAQNAL